MPKGVAHNPNHRIAIGVFDLGQLKVAQGGGGQPRLCRNIFRGLRSRRGDDTYGRAFEPCFHGRVHSGTERLVHGEMSSAVIIDFVGVAH